MKKQITLKKSKEKAWKAFSQYIRVRDAINSTDTRDRAECFTCEVVYPIKSLQAGHFIPGRHNAVLFDEKNCHAQCYGCNIGKKGSLIVYFRKMQRIYGDRVIKNLEKKDKKIVQFKVIDYLDLERIYKEKLEKL